MDVIKYLHVINNWNYSIMLSFVEFIDKNFSKNDHFFLIMDNIDNIPTGILEYNNIIVYKDASDIFYKDFKYIYSVAENIILHGLAFNTYQQIILLLIPRFFEKVTWIAWGADLYQTNSNLEGSLFRKIKKAIKNYVNIKTRKKIKYFVGIFPPDIEYFKEKFKSSARAFYASYTVNLNNPLYKKKIKRSTLKRKIYSNKTINIQIGHSSFPILNHELVLENLRKYYNYNIKIFLPLNYGDKEYGNYIERIAKKTFKDKIVVIRKMMTLEEYMEHLENMDIVIFNTSRQIGLGNISPLLFLGKKLYMPKGSVMYEFYKSQNIEIQDYNKIKNYSFEEFVKPVTMLAGKKYVENNELDNEKKVEMWAKVFSEIQNKAD